VLPPIVSKDSTTADSARELESLTNTATLNSLAIEELVNDNENTHRIAANKNNLIISASSNKKLLTF
jgi:hypothetical protein